MNWGHIIDLMTGNIEALAFNRQQEANTWEPMILAEMDPPSSPDGKMRIKFVPNRCSPAFPGDMTYYWTREELLKRTRKVAETTIAEVKE